MKKIIIVLALILTYCSYSQTYKFEAMGTEVVTVKSFGSIIINDKQVLIGVNDKGKRTLNEYQLIKKTNGLVYFTDGVMTHYFSFVQKSGIEKGFDYDTWVIFNFDKSQGTEPIIYYCKFQE